MGKCVVEHAVAVEIYLLAVVGFEESELAGWIEPYHRSNRGAFVVLHLSLQLANTILQLSARPLEGIVDSESQVGMSLVGLRGAIDIDFPAVRKRQADIDLIESACAVMTAGGFQHHPASRNATKPLFEVGHMLGNGSLDFGLAVMP